jgi:hypothetical protein
MSWPMPSVWGVLSPACGLMRGGRHKVASRLRVRKPPIHGWERHAALAGSLRGPSISGVSNCGSHLPDSRRIETESSQDEKSAKRIYVFERLYWSDLGESVQFVREGLP